VRYRFQKSWCSACKLMQYPGECGHPYLVAPDVSPRRVRFGLTPSDGAGIKAAALAELVKQIDGGRPGDAGSQKPLFKPLPRR